MLAVLPPVVWTGTATIFDLPIVIKGDCHFIQACSSNLSLIVIRACHFQGKNTVLPVRGTSSAEYGGIDSFFEGIKVHRASKGLYSSIGSGVLEEGA